MCLSYFAYKELPLEDLVFFHIVANQHQHFASIDTIESFDYHHLVLGYTYDPRQLETIIEDQFVDMDTYYRYVLNIWEPKFKDFPQRKELSDDYVRAQKRYAEDKARELSRLMAILNANNSKHRGELKPCKDMITQYNLFDSYNRTNMFGTSDPYCKAVVDSLLARYQIWLDNKKLVDFLARVQDVYDRIGASQKMARLQDVSSIDTEMTLPSFVDHLETYRLVFHLQLHPSAGFSNDEQELVETAARLFRRGRLVDANNNIIDKDHSEEEEKTKDEDESDAGDKEHEQDGPEFPISGKRIEQCQLSISYFEYLKNSWRRHHADEQLQQQPAQTAIEELSAVLKQREESWKTLIDRLWTLVKRIFGSANDMPPLVSQSLIDSGLWPRFTPIHVVKYVLNNSNIDSNKHPSLVTK